MASNKGEILESFDEFEVKLNVFQASSNVFKNIVEKGIEVSMNKCLSSSDRFVFTYLSDFDNTNVAVKAEVVSLVILFISAIISNIMMFVAILRSGSLMNNTHILLTNLVASGLLFSVHNPAIVVTRITREWILGQVFCKMFNYCEFVSGTCSILTMVAISYDRYLCITNGGQNRLSKKRLILITAAVWLIACAFSGPVIISQRVKDFYKTETICPDQAGTPLTTDRRTCRLGCVSYKYCGVTWPTGFMTDVYILVMTVLFYVIPLASFVVFYTKIFLIVRRSQRRVTHHVCKDQQSNSSESAEESRKKQACRRTASRQEVQLAKMSGIIITSFLLLWMPFFVLATIGARGIEDITSPFIIAMIFAHANICVNPIIYGYFNPAFREQCRVVPLTLVKAVRSIKLVAFSRYQSRDKSKCSKNGGGGEEEESKTQTGKNPKRNSVVQMEDIDRNSKSRVQEEYASRAEESVV